jgi:ornithine--oxo-acid transaminase
MRDGLNAIAAKNSLIRLVRGKGLLNAIVIDCDEESDLAWDICLKFRDYGLLANQLMVKKLFCSTSNNRSTIKECLVIIEKH